MDLNLIIDTGTWMKLDILLNLKIITKEFTNLKKYI